jgi:hypothetical protein
MTTTRTTTTYATNRARIAATRKPTPVYTPSVDRIAEMVRRIEAANNN